MSDTISRGQGSENIYDMKKKPYQLAFDQKV